MMSKNELDFDNFNFVVSDASSGHIEAVALNLRRLGLRTMVKCNFSQEKGFNFFYLFVDNRCEVCYES